MNENDTDAIEIESWKLDDHKKETLVTLMHRNLKTVRLLGILAILYAIIIIHLIKHWLIEILFEE